MKAHKLCIWLFCDWKILLFQESGTYRPPGLLPQCQQSHNQVVDSRLPGSSQHQRHVSPPLPPTNSTRTPVITTNPPMSQAPCSVSHQSNGSRSNSVAMAGASTVTTSPPAGCSVNNGSSSSWQRGREPVSQTSSGAVAGPKSHRDALQQPGNQRGPAPTANQPHQQGATKFQHMKAKMAYYAQAQLEKPPPFSSSSSLFSSGHHRAGDSVITSTVSNPLSSSPTTYCPVSHATVSSAPQPSSPARPSKQMFSHSQAVPQSIEEALDKLDAELQGHMQAEERRKRDREEQERKRKEERERRERELRQKQEEERRRIELERKEEERKRELARQEEEKRRRERERQEQERRQEEERKRLEVERLEKERKRREWERERERKRREWEKQQQEEEKRRREAEKREQERKKREQEREEENKKQKELERKEEEKKRMERSREDKLCGAKGKEQAAIENLERLLSENTSPVPPPPPLSSITASPSGPSLPSSQASPPYPWLSRGGLIPCQPGQTPTAAPHVERLRPPPLTPQTDYAREKQRQREMWSNNGGTTFSPSPTNNTSGMNQPVYPNKPPAMQAAPNQSKDPARERDGGQHSLPTVALREPPKLYHAFSRENLPSLSTASTRGLLSKQVTGGNLGIASSCSTDSDSAQFEEESSESTLLPDGLANIMAMLDESIKKEEEMYNSEKNGPTGLIGTFPPGAEPTKSYLCAPDLVPATKHQPSHEDRSNASPPVLSRQGSLASPCSRTSSLNEDDEDYVKPSPNVPVNPKQSVDMAVGVGNTNYRHSDLAKLYGLPEQTKSDADEDEDDEEEEEDSEAPSCSPPPQRPHLHQTGVNSTFKSRATLPQSQKYTYRGGPFGRPPPSALVGVKYSSSLSLGPDICCQQSSSPTSDSTNPPFSPAVPPVKSSPRSLLEDKKLKLEDSDVWTDEGESEESLTFIKKKSIPTTKPIRAVKEEQELTTISESSLAELDKSCEVMLCRQSLHYKHSHEKRDGQGIMGNRHKLEKVREHREKGRSRDRQRDKEKKRRHGHSSSRKHDERKEKKKHRDKKYSSSSTHSSSGHKRHKDGKGHKEKDRRILSDLNLQRKEGSEKTLGHYETEKKKCKEASNGSSTSEGERGEWTSSSGERSSEHAKGESGSSLASVDLMKLKALSDGPPKELKIRLIKVESGDRETFIASEVEEKRIPLVDISIKNTASEIIRSCK